MRIQGLTFAYGDFPVFADFSLDTSANPLLIRGPSGCGKTTLLKLLTGNLRADAASLMPAYESKALILQEDALFPWISGWRNLSLFLNGRQEAARQHPLFPLVATFLPRYAYQLSFGQRRLIELFRVLLYAPRLLCLDEPFNYLDPALRRMVADHLLHLTSRGVQLIVASHYHEDFGDLGGSPLVFDGNLPVRTLGPHAT